MGFLRPGEKGRRYKVWMDRLMPGGADWSPEIEAKARACDIFVLLVSTHSTGSDYILDKEIPIVRERQRNDEASISIRCCSTGPPRLGLSRSTTRTFARATASHCPVSAQASAAGQMTEAANEIAGLRQGDRGQEGRSGSRKSADCQAGRAAKILARASATASWPAQL